MCKKGMSINATGYTNVVNTCNVVNRLRRIVVCRILTWEGLVRVKLN